MRVRIKLFARARQLVGTDAIEIELPDGGSVGLLRESIGRQHPELSELLQHVLFAVDGEYAADGEPIPDGAEVACIPPVSGG